jgi:hypothetical protein
MKPEELKLLQELGKTNYGFTLKNYCKHELKKYSDIRSPKANGATADFIETLLAIMETGELTERKKNDYT